MRALTDIVMGLLREEGRADRTAMRRALASLFE
jgi:hypothetical protein